MGDTDGRGDIDRARDTGSGRPDQWVWGGGEAAAGGTGGWGRESQPPGDNEGRRRSADWLRNERPLSSEPFAEGLQAGGAGPRGFLLPLPSLQGLQGAEGGAPPHQGTVVSLVQRPAVRPTAARAGSLPGRPSCSRRLRPHLPHNPGSLGSLPPMWRLPSMPRARPQGQPRMFLLVPRSARAPLSL